MNTLILKTRHEWISSKASVNVVYIQLLALGSSYETLVKKKDSVSQGSYNYEREIVRDFILPPILTEGITTTFEDIPYAKRSSWNFFSSYLKL